MITFLRSEVFGATFSHPLKENKENVVEIEDADPTVLEVFLRQDLIQNLLKNLRIEWFNFTQFQILVHWLDWPISRTSNGVASSDFGWQIYGW